MLAELGQHLAAENGRLKEQLRDAVRERDEATLARETLRNDYNKLSAVLADADRANREVDAALQAEREVRVPRPPPLTLRTANPALPLPCCLCVPPRTAVP